MKAKKPRTKTHVGLITSALRKIWMWSPERGEIVKRANRHCEECGCDVANTRKEGDKKGIPCIEIHHVEPCDMTELAKKAWARMFPGPEKLLGVCPECHEAAEEVLKRERSL